MLIRPPMTHFKMTVRADCAASACSPLPLSIKALAPDCQWGRRPLDSLLRPPPHPQLPASKIKQTFLSTNLASLLAFERQVAGPRFWLQLEVSSRGST